MKSAAFATVSALSLIAATKVFAQIPNPDLLARLISRSMRDPELVAAGHDGRAKVHYDATKAFSEANQAEDLEAITVAALVLHGEDVQVHRIIFSARIWALSVQADDATSTRRH